jgi:hypothetical protein
LAMNTASNCSCTWAPCRCGQRRCIPSSRLSAFDLLVDDLLGGEFRNAVDQTCPPV